MKIKYCLFCVVIIISLNTYAQDNSDNKLKYYKHEFGIQFNPLLDKSFRSGYRTYISSAIYLYHFNKYLALGPAISNSHLKPSTTFSSNTYNAGVISKLTYSNRTRFTPFAEVYTGVQFGKSRYFLNGSSDETIYKSQKFNYYVAPGVKLMFKNSRFSFDLMYKLSSMRLYNYKNAVFSWRFCYSFGKTNK